MIFFYMLLVAVAFALIAYVYLFFFLPNRRENSNKLRFVSHFATLFCLISCILVFEGRNLVVPTAACIWLVFQTEKLAYEWSKEGGPRGQKSPTVNRDDEI